MNKPVRKPPTQRAETMRTMRNIAVKAPDRCLAWLDNNGRVSTMSASFPAAAARIAAMPDRVVGVYDQSVSIDVVHDDIIFTRRQLGLGDLP